MTPDRDSRSVAELFGDMVGHAARLMRGEIDLARAEIDESLRRAGAGIGMLVVAVVVALVALNMLAAAAAAALALAGLDPLWSTIIVGLVLALIGVVLVNRGIAALKQVRFAPSRATRGLREDFRIVKEATNGER